MKNFLIGLMSGLLAGTWGTFALWILIDHDYREKSKERYKYMSYRDYRAKGTE